MGGHKTTNVIMRPLFVQPFFGKHPRRVVQLKLILIRYQQRGDEPLPP